MKPLIAFSGEFWDGASGLGLADGFRGAGFDVAKLDIGDYIAATGGDLLLRAMSRVSAPRSVAKYREWLLSSCALDPPRILFSIKGTYLDRDTLLAIKKQGSLLAMFYPDVDFDHTGVDPDVFNLYDFIFTTKRFHLPWMRETLRGPAIHHIDHGYSTRTHLCPEPAMVDMQRFDVGFVGNYSPYKHQWLSEIVALRPALSFAVAGPNWASPTRGTALHTVVLGEVFGTTYRRLIARCRINLAIHHGKTRSGWADDVSTRTFEIPAAHGFMLHIDNAEIRSLYDVGGEIDTFATPKEAAEKIDFYLASPERRLAIAQAGFDRAVPAYSYDARAAAMARLMGFG